MQVLEAIRTKRSTRQFEAQPVGDDVIRAILNAGRLEQIGTPSDVYHRPANAFVADFMAQDTAVIPPI